jgi:rhamnosyl/mannosyltransferase
MNILHVFKTFINDSMGGTEQVIAQLASTVHASETKHTVLSLSKDASGLITGVGGIDNLRYREDLMIASNSMSWRLLRDFRRIVKAYDVIHYHFPWPFADMLHLVAQVSKPSVITYHSDVVRQKLWLKLYQPLMHYFLKSVDAIVATSPQYLATSPVLKPYSAKTTVVPIGIDRSHYPVSSPERLSYWRDRYGKGFFLFVGMMRYYKGLSVLLDAIAGTDLSLLIVGCGPLEEELKQQAKRLKLNNVHFVGHVTETDKMALLELSLGFVFPSTMRSEAFGVSLLEAAMLGKPLISTEIGTGSSYVNLHETTGLVVPPNHVNALREALRYIGSHPEEAQRMGEQAALRHQALFTGQHMVAGYEAVYRSVCMRSNQDQVARNSRATSLAK